MIRFSIIIPIYKVEKYLNKCVNSVLKQTYSNLEIILVDDGSPDNCPKMCDEYLKKDNRIKVIHKENGGLSSARNAGLDIAKGDYILFVDSDDYVDYSLCEEILSYFHDDVDIVAFEYEKFYDNNISNIKSQMNDNEISVIELNNNDTYMNYLNRKIFTQMAWDKMYRSSVINELRFIEGRLAEDLSMAYYLFGRSRKSVFVNRSLYHYYIREDSIMGVAGFNLVRDAYLGEIETYNFSIKNYPTLTKEANSRFLNQSMKFYLKLLFIEEYNSQNLESYLTSVHENICKINKRNLKFKTNLFFYLFCVSKRAAWLAFKILKLS